MIEQVLEWDNLRLAWEEVAHNRGAPGIDQVSIRRWQRNWEERLAELAGLVRANTYRPRPLRRFTIPKKDGSPRRMAIPTVTDRVLQRAVLQVIDGRFDAGFFPGSYGYRTGRGLRDAIPAILKQQQAGNTWVLDADIDECFDSLDHELLLGFIMEDLEDAVILRLIIQWLKIGRRSPDAAVGVPLGSVVSPLFCNIYLHRLDAALAMRGYSVVRYADDFCVFCPSQPTARQAWEDTAAAVAQLKLRLEPAKTRITSFQEGFDFLGIRFEESTWSFIRRDKKVVVRTCHDFPGLYDDVPEGYESIP